MPISTLDALVTHAVSAAIARPEVEAAPSAAGAIADEVTRAVAPILTHAANSEPWYRSRVTWGAILSIVVPMLGAAGMATEWIDPDIAVAMLTAAGGAAGGALTLYGRWKARGPIGA